MGYSDYVHLTPIPEALASQGVVYGADIVEHLKFISHKKGNNYIGYYQFLSSEVYYKIYILPAAFSEAGCTSCHGANFDKVAMGKSKVVTEMTAEEITTALNGYKDGSYGGAMKAVMKSQATGMSEDDIKAFADKYGKK